MQRREINAAVVQEAERLFRQGLKPATVAAQLEITPYVAGLLANHVDLAPCTSRPSRTDRRAASVPAGIDAGMIRSIQRMLAVGRLRQKEIARETGISTDLVSEVACGKRPATTLRRRKVSEGELFLTEPIRCGGCGALVSVVPCRACRTRLAMLIQRWLQNNSFGFLILHFPARRLFDVLVGNLSKTVGAKAMQDLITVLSDEIAAFLSAQDKREHLIARSEKLFDQVVAPMDLPGPDKIVDPLLRAAIRPLVGRVWDEMVKKMEAPSNAA